MTDYKININGEMIDLNPHSLEFNQETLSDYLQKEASLYNYYGFHLAVSEKILQEAELAYEELYSHKYEDYKDSGGTDKLAEAKTKGDSTIVSAKQKVIDAKLNVRLLQQHLKAWDKNHENCINYGHTLRKELDKLGACIKQQHHNDSIYSKFDEVDQIVGHYGDLPKEE